MRLTHQLSSLLDIGYPDLKPSCRRKLSKPPQTAPLSYTASYGSTRPAGAAQICRPIIHQLPFFILSDITLRRPSSIKRYDYTAPLFYGTNLKSC